MLIRTQINLLITTNLRLKLGAKLIITHQLKALTIKHQKMIISIVLKDKIEGTPI
jgi:hypothetical protein